MPIIKKIDIFVLKKFFLLFAGSFVVCQFVLIMQFLWRYIDELIGKGLTLDVLARFFGYASVTLVPQALPLAILLASLISFGNMGEDLELTAMKAAGIPLRRIMAPVGVVSILLCIVSFIFQNNISPNAQKELTRMVATMKETSPAIEIPEGVFYSGIPNVNIYVDHKNASTGMLYKVIIYKVDGGFENAQIVVADSARLETTADKHFLSLAVMNGEQFENLQSGSTSLLNGTQVPYDRETFGYKTLLIDFDSGFDLMDAEDFAGMAKVKNLRELDAGYDSIMHLTDSVGRTFYESLQARYLILGKISPADSARALKAASQPAYRPDSLFDKLTPERRQNVVSAVQLDVKNALTELDFERPMTNAGYKNARKHLIEWHKKFALALSCIIFFFIGAPLGAIIRKGGLGLPTVISVLIFILYYIINTSGMKLARDGTWSVLFGMWVSTLVLAPLGAFITYKANNDSVVFNFDAYKTAIRRFFGLKQGRLILPKEVIIETPDYAKELENVEALSRHCREYVKKHHLPHAANYFKMFFGRGVEDDIKDLQQEMEGIIERLSNSKDLHLLDALSKYPEIYTNSHTNFSRREVNVTLGVLFPLGLFFWFRIWRFRILLYRDLRTIVRCNEKTSKQIKKILSDAQK